MFCKAIHAGTEDQLREDQDKTIVYLMEVELHDATTNEKLDKKKIVESRPEERKHFETIEVYKKDNRKNWTTTRRHQVGRRQAGQGDVTGAGWWGIDQAMFAATLP